MNSKTINMFSILSPEKKETPAEDYFYCRQNPKSREFYLNQKAKEYKIIIIEDKGELIQ